MFTSLPIEYKYSNTNGTVTTVNALPMITSANIDPMDHSVTFEAFIETNHAVPPALALQETLAYQFQTADGNGTSAARSWGLEGVQYSNDGMRTLKFKVKHSGYLTTSSTNAATYACFATDNHYLDTSDCFWKLKPIKSASERLREIISGRSAPAILVRHKYLPPTTDIKEQRARETLKLVVGQEMYEKFLSKGFVSVQNPVSGRVYQIFPGHGMTNVYERGVHIQRLCVYLRGDFPPTDGLIVRYLMAINNEEQLWKLSNKHAAYPRKQQISAEATRSLVDIFREFKKAS